MPKKKKTYKQIMQEILKPTEKKPKEIKVICGVDFTKVSQI